MPAFQLNDDEWGALAEEPAEAFKLYCAIRRFMDYRTGIAGKSRRLSEQMLREVLYVAPLPGRHAPAEITRQKVRSLLKRLETIGMIVSIGPLVLQLPLATSDGLSKTGATKEQPEQQPQEQPHQSSTEPNEFGGSDDFEGGAGTAAESPELPSSNLPPVSGKSPTTLSARGYFAMHDGWQPQAKTWGPTALRNAIPKAVPAETLNEFRSYWIARPDKEQSQAQWEHQLAQSLKHHIRQAQAGGYTHGNPRAGSGGSAAPGQQRRLSAVGRVEANVAAARAARGEGAGAPEPWTAGETLDHDDPDLWPQVDLSIR
ncbi:DnaT-like ssDNA-binding domain-containing protein [Pseudomonas plecoglossicida]|uniref:DnaT-like ssDNA-binding domain-containing protein n=1 Tax=Pseudomonas putida group TaxID=136845 RepID=UPI00240FA031|nr:MULTISPECIES: DnaT-like ssDNA-binding domain-containing protein [Pseudomonas putida group]MDQ7965530.1 DnaT-like ssDNA-binding domain-containing protein [Pseudomonas plecoglossicida]WFG03755.1 DnaT-like ssDNA-binding domain-containing protein [Pseudomonas putida]